MVRVRNGRISYCPLEKIYGRLSVVNPVTEYDSDRYNGRRTILNEEKKSASAKKSQR
jgi:hypothetical protein